MNALLTDTWGDHSVSTEDRLQCQLENLQIVIMRDQQQWMLAHRYTEEESDNLSVSEAETPEDWPQDSWSRFVFAATTGKLEIRPALPDRSIVSRPISPFSLQPEETTEIFITTPLWAQIRVHDSATLLKELPTIPLSDTWFGPSTMSGELCYAMATRARLSLNERQRLAYRAITQVNLNNQTDAPLVVERINLPAPYLTLYRDAAGDYLTESIALMKTKDGLEDSASTSNSAIEQLEIISGPRKVAKSDLVSNVFATLFG